MDIEDRSTDRPKNACRDEPLKCVVDTNTSLALVDPSQVNVRDEIREFLSNYLLLLLRSLSAFDAADVPKIVSATTSLVTACLSPSRGHFVEAQRPIDIVHLDRAAKIIAERLADRDLTPDQLCRQLGISRSSLYRLFEPVGGVSSYVRRQRLLKTREMLSDRSDRRTISSIAEEWSFTDPSTYSRMFRKEFGITPREARAKGRRNKRPIDLDAAQEPIDKPLALGNLLLNRN